MSGLIAEKANSSGGMVWPTARDEAELVEDFGLVIREQDQIDYGFSSFDGMLHWAIGKSSSPFVFFFSFSFTMYSSRSDSTISGTSLGSGDIEGSS